MIAASPRTSIALVGVAAGSWVVAAHQMRGMDMGTTTELGPLPSFVAIWVAMMAAMMLPGAVPAVSRFGRAHGRFVTELQFAGAYLVVWTLVGLVLYGVYQPHGTLAAGVLTVAAGVYELTPLKRNCRRRCRETIRTGFEFGLYCVGSSIGLMAILLALGAMNMVWMALVALVVLAQKLLPPRTAMDVPIAFAICALGFVVALAPAAIPVLTRSM